MSPRSFPFVRAWCVFAWCLFVWCVFVCLLPSFSFHAPPHISPSSSTSTFSFSNIPTKVLGEHPIAVLFACNSHFSASWIYSYYSPSCQGPALPFSHLAGNQASRISFSDQLLKRASQTSFSTQPLDLASRPNFLTRLHNLPRKSPT